MLRIADNDPNDSGRTITTYLYLSDAAQENTMEALRCLGYKGNDLAELADESIDTELLLPNDVSFPINYEEYNGTSRPKVGPIRRAGAGSVALKNKLEGNEAKQFGLRFKALCAAHPAGAEPKAKPAIAKPRTRQQAPINEDADDCGDFNPDF
jgi:hypothetical protein